MNLKLSKYLSVLFFFSANILIAQQDLIHNAGFEDNDDDSKPTGLHEVSFLNVWVDEYKEVSKDCNDDAIEEMYEFHSPDWYCNEGGKMYIKEDIGNTGNLIPIESHSGSCYVGMGPCELIQQQFFNDNQLSKGDDYTLSMYIRIPALPNFTSVSPVKTWSNSGSALLNVFLNQDKIDYSIEANNPCKLCTDGCFKRVTDSQPVEIMSIEVNKTKFPPGQWHKISVTFPAPVPELPLLPKNDWITIELQDPTQCNSIYVLIDDVSLQCGCDVECSRTDGCFNPLPFVTGTFVDKLEINKSQGIKITNLNNPTKAILTIKTPQDQFVYSKTVECKNGILGDIYWYGTNSGGGPVANGKYYIYLTLENDCGTDEFSEVVDGFNGEVIKIDNYDPTTDPNGGPLIDYYCNYYNLVTPVPCCGAQPDIYLNNMSIAYPGQEGIIEYIALNNIYVGPNVIIEGTNLLLRAGNEIIGDPYEEAELGAFITAEIVPCPSVQRLGQFYDEEAGILPESTIQEIQNDPYQQNTIFGKNQSKKPLFTLQPNPTANGMFTLTSNYFSYNNIAVINVLGEIVFQINNPQQKEPESTMSKIIDISLQPKGVYFVKVQNEDGAMAVQKVVYQ